MRWFLTILFLSSASIVHAQVEPSKVALIIGNTNYEVGPLRNPVNDANLMTNTLRALGFEVIKVLDATKAQMVEAVREFEGKVVANQGPALFYYSGHGLQVDGANYLVPVDADIKAEYEVESTCLRADRVLRMLEYHDNPLNIVILDACRNNPYTRSFRSGTRGLTQPTAAPTGSIVAFSTAPNSVASDGSGTNGLYTQELVKAMLTPNMSIEDVFKVTRRSVVQLSNEEQVPWENSSLLGDFYFLGEGETVSVDPVVIPSVTTNDEERTSTEQVENRTAPAPDFGYGPDEFSTVFVAGKVWTLQNLNVTHFSDGTEIMQVKTEEEWEQMKAREQPAWFEVEHEGAPKPIYGKLYNYWAVTDPRGLCPQGFKVPSAEDFFAVWRSVTGKKQPERVLSKHLIDDNWGKEATHLSGLDFPPAGGFSQEYKHYGKAGRVWSRSIYQALTKAATNKYGLALLIGKSSTIMQPTGKSAGLSVRCVQQ
ncbi:MAG: caspase family protein [Cyclobacteriaceae bacterium]